MKKTVLTISSIVSTCFFVFAQTGGAFFTPATSLIGAADRVISSLLPLLVGVGLAGFFWFMVVFIWKAADNPTEREKAKKGMAWSIGAIFVMVSVWGIIIFFSNMFGIGLGGEMPGFVLPGSQ